jgi:hypothetical protein
VVWWRGGVVVWWCGGVFGAIVCLFLGVVCVSGVSGGFGVVCVLEVVGGRERECVCVCVVVRVCCV